MSEQKREEELKRLEDLRRLIKDETVVSERELTEAEIRYRKETMKRVNDLQLQMYWDFTFGRDLSVPVSEMEQATGRIIRRDPNAEPPKVYTYTSLK